MKEHVVIIGGSSGIGLAGARLLANSMKVTIAGRDEHRLAAAKATIDGDIDALVFDATSGSARSSFFAGLAPFDHLVLALGSRRGLGPLASLTEEEVVAGFAEKVWPHLFCAQAALPHIRATGSVTFLSAISGQAAMPGTVGIGSANAAIAAFVPILAAELKPLRVNAVSPGVVDTPWWDFLGAEQRQGVLEGFAARSPVGRIGQPEDIAAAIAFLVTNGFTTGTLLICDGGARLAA